MVTTKKLKLNHFRNGTVEEDSSFEDVPIVWFCQKVEIPKEQSDISGIFQAKYTPAPK